MTPEQALSVVTYARFMDVHWAMRIIGDAQRLGASRAAMTVHATDYEGVVATLKNLGYRVHTEYSEPRRIIVAW